jgi:lipopolysaccharide biosynthesis glycosyltransferase
MTSRNDTPIPLFLSSDFGSQHGMVVTIESALENSSPDFRVALHIGDCGLDPEVRTSMERVWSVHPKVASLTFHDLNLENFKGRMRVGLPVAALARLQITTLIPEGDRAIYLDTDLLVLGDLKELAEIDLQGNPVAGVIEGYFKTLRESGYKLSEIPMEVVPDAPYFNSGMLVIDLAKWRDIPVWETGEMLLSQYRDKFSHNDQAVLNLLFSGRTLMLPDHWNRQRPMFDELPVLKHGDGGIIHFIGRTKPWNFSYRPNCGAVSLWHEVLRRSKVELPPLAKLNRSYRGPLPILWGRKLVSLAMGRIKSKLRR